MAILARGCGGTTIPAQLEVRDVSTSRTYTTHEPWAEVEKGVGYHFTDVDTGLKVTPTNEETRRLETAMTVSTDSPEAKAFAAAEARGRPPRTGRRQRR